MSKENSTRLAIDPAAPAEVMRKTYDSYFASQDYKRRYPSPNQSTLQFLLDHGQAASAKSILDVGCGDGRYALALLDATAANITGCDISSGALHEFSAQLATRLDAKRVTLIHSTVEALEPSANANNEPDLRHDLSLLLFGVLSHAGDQAARLAMLKAVLRQTKPEGRLLLTVPNIWRRWPIELLQQLGQRLGQQLGQRRARSETNNLQFGDMTYCRVIDGQEQTFFYHLYSLGRLRQELDLAGWSIQTVQAESVLPEWMVTQYRWIGRLDNLVRPLLPASLGYGISVVARIKSQRQEPSKQTGNNG